MPINHSVIVAAGMSWERWEQVFDVIVGLAVAAVVAGSEVDGVPGLGCGGGHEVGRCLLLLPGWSCWDFDDLPCFVFVFVNFANFDAIPEGIIDVKFWRSGCRGSGCHGCGVSCNIHHIATVIKIHVVL